MISLREINEDLLIL